MRNLYNAAQRKWLTDLRKFYCTVTNGICMATIGAGHEAPTEPCEGPIGRRHAIAERHLKLIAEDMGGGYIIRANKEHPTFEDWSAKCDELQPVPISQFSAGKWSCQRHDERFKGIDGQQIDLSEPENLFKAVYRVVLRQNHLTLARWYAHSVATESDEGWQRFKETAFSTPASDDVAEKAVKEWSNVAHAVMGKSRDLERRLARKEWDSLDYRAFFLKSSPALAGWGCLMMKFPTGGLPPDDPRRHWNCHVELGYMIVIPQEDGHAIVTACEPDTQYRVPEISRIHKYMPVCVNPNDPSSAEGRLRRDISRKIWEVFDEFGMRESLYRSWSAADQNEVQAWMKKQRWMRQPTLLNQPSSRLPDLL